MQRFENILVHLGDRTQWQPALGRAVDLALRNGARLELVDVMDEIPGFIWDRVSDPDVVRDKQRVAQQRRLEEAAEDLIDSDVKVKTRLLEGRAAVEIIREVLRGGHDLVVKTAQQSFSEDHRFLGTVDWQLARMCPVPVWLMRPGAARFRRIVAALDLEPGEAPRDSLNIKLVELARSLAVMEDGELDVVHALDPYPEEFMREHFPVDRAQALKQEHREAALRSLHEVLRAARCELSEDRIHVLDGHAGHEVPLFVREHDTDLLVMGTVTDAATDGRLVSDAAESILLRAGCSVFTVKPDGFVSPVRSAVRSPVQSPLRSPR